MDYLTDAAGRTTLDINAKQAKKIMAACWTDAKELPLLGCHLDLNVIMDPKDETSEDSNFRLELAAEKGGTFQLHIYAKESVNMDGVSDAFLAAIGELLTELKLPWWEVGVAETGSRHAPGAFGGSSFRILCNGSLVWADEVWPMEVLELYAKMAAAE